jgi:hypothetical protein
LGGHLKERSIAVAVAALVIFLSTAAVAFAYFHTTNGVLHGLEDQIWGTSHYPKGATNAGGSAWSTAEVRHYFDDGSYNTQCTDTGWGSAYCEGNWGTAPCQKRYVGGADGYLSRHWVRWVSPPCGGQMHS